MGLNGPFHNALELIKQICDLAEAMFFLVYNMQQIQNLCFGYSATFTKLIKLG